MRDHFALVSSEFQQFLADSAAFYDHLRQRLLNWLLANRPVPSDAQANAARCRQSLHRCLVFLGDLARYRELHSQRAKKNFSAAEGFYLKALALLPENGNPHNQLAVLATYVEAETVAVYRYCRSLLIAQPFATAEENLALLFERSRQRPLAAPPSSKNPATASVTVSSPGKDKAASLKSFLHRLTRLHGLLFSIVTKQSQASTSYPREMETMLFLDFAALLRAGIVGDALLLKIVVTNIFCVVRASKAASSNSNNTVAMEHALRLAMETLSCVFKLLLENDLSSQKSYAAVASAGNASKPLDASPALRLLGPVVVFCEYLQCNPSVLEQLEALHDQQGGLVAFGQTFVDQLVTFLNHNKIKALYRPLVHQQSSTAKQQQLWLKENIEMRGFAPLASLLDTPEARIDHLSAQDASPSAGGVPPALSEPEALKVRAWALYQFGSFLAEDYEGNPLLYLSNGTFSTQPIASDVVPRLASGGGSLFQTAGPESESSLPVFDLGLLARPTGVGAGITPTKRYEDDDEDVEDEVIVYQPAAFGAIAGTGGSSALGGSANAVLSSNAGSNGSSPFAFRSRKNQDDGGAFAAFANSNNSLSNGSLAMTLGYPNFNSFSQFASQGDGLFSGWGNDPTASTSSLSGMNERPQKPLPPSSLPFTSGTFAPMSDLAAVERESSLYQHNTSSLSAFLNPSSSSPLDSEYSSADSMFMASKQSVRSTPPPPGFGGPAPPGLQPPSSNPWMTRAADSPPQQQQQQPSPFFTRNPFINS